MVVRACGGIAAAGAALMALAVCTREEAPLAVVDPEDCRVLRGIPEIGRATPPGVASGSGQPLVADTVAQGLEAPWALAFLPNGDLLLTERAGRLRRVRAGTLDPRPLAVLSVVARDEAGLLGLAVAPSPSHAADTEPVDPVTLFVYYTRADGARLVNRIERWRLEGDTARPESVLLDHIPGGRFNNGGRLRVGPDGHLYAGTGDAGRARLAQDPAILAGKILRITTDGVIPDDNPFPGSPVFVLGVRNPQGFDWTEDGRLVVADQGPTGELGRRGFDELSVAWAGDNLGWPLVSGCAGRTGVVTPTVTWSPAAPPGGAIVLRGEIWGPLRGQILVTHLGGPHLQRLALRGDVPPRLADHEVLVVSGAARLRDAVEGPDGHLYLTTNDCDGRGPCPPPGDRVVRVRAPGADGLPLD
jgi:glucose/arabinose dehydrogenase